MVESVATAEVWGQGWTAMGTIAEVGTAKGADVSAVVAMGVGATEVASVAGVGMVGAEWAAAAAAQRQAGRVEGRAVLGVWEGRVGAVAKRVGTTVVARAVTKVGAIEGVGMAAARAAAGLETVGGAGVEGGADGEGAVAVAEGSADGRWDATVVVERSAMVEGEMAAATDEEATVMAWKVAAVQAAR